MDKLFVFAALCLSASAQWTVGQKVDTTSGIMIGTESTMQPGVSEYLGIKFGESTAGPNRFMPPRRFRSNDTFIAKKFSDGCPSALDIPYAFTMGEDCLTLNVFTKPQVGEKKKAVMVWMYGGGFSIGDAATPVYIGANLAARQDVVVVSINYRTNIFGFPSMPLLNDTNLGLLDQRMAVEWVRDNIEAFGGDSKRITIFGESAGGSSVDFYAYAWPEDPIINGIIAQSGTATISGGLKPRTKDVRGWAWYQVSQKLGCGGSAQGLDTVRCLQTKTWQEVFHAIPTVGEGGVPGITPFGPTADEKVVFSDYPQRVKDGQLIKVPILVGSNHNESALFSFSGRFTGDKWPPAKLQAVDNAFTCGARDAAKARMIHGVPSWRYHFADNRKGVYDGAPHAAEIPYVFDSGAAPYRLVTSLMGAANLPSLGPIMQAAWAAFAKDPLNGLSNYGWPKYNEGGNTLIRLGYNGEPKVDFPKQDLYDSTCPPAQF